MENAFKLINSVTNSLFEVISGLSFSFLNLVQETLHISKIAIAIVNDLFILKC